MLSLVQMTYKCKYCNKEFARETTLMSHMCERKRRVLAKDDKQNRIAYQSWLLYRRLSMANVKNDKPYEDFVDNSLFTGFMKLAKYMIDMNFEKPEEFVKFIVMNSVKMHDWTKIFVHQEFVKDKLKTETVDRAIERSLLNMKEWAERTGNNWQDYFVQVNTVEAVQDIKMGRLSPWCTFATDQGSRFIDRLEPGQVQELIDFLNPQAWKARIKRQQEDADWVQEVFNKAEIQ